MNPLEFNDLTKKQFEAEKSLKHYLVNPPIFVLHPGNKPCKLYMVTALIQVGCTILQERDSPKDYRSIPY